MNKLLLMATLLIGCTHTQYDAGIAFITSVDTALMARELTDEEIDNADTGTGSGFSHSRNAGEDAVDVKIEDV